MSSTIPRPDFRSYMIDLISRYKAFARELFLASLPDGHRIERRHPDLLLDLVKLCAHSYKWTPSSFRSEMEKRGASSFMAFGRRAGSFRWRVVSLFCLPLSAILLPLLFSFFVLIVLALASADLSNWSEPNGSVLRSVIVFVTETVSVTMQSFNWVSQAATRYLVVAQTALPSWAGTALGVAGEYFNLIGAILFQIAGWLLFWVPAGLKLWIGVHAPPWIGLLLVEIRALIGLTFLLGLLTAAILLVFPRFASARAFGILDRRSKRAIVVLCGSQLVDNFTINACVWFYRNPLRHFGFHRAWDHIAPDVRRWLAEVLPEDGDIILTGHSLGGALAEVAAFDLAGEFPVSLVAAFGSSRIGGADMRFFSSAPAHGSCCFTASSRATCIRKISLLPPIILCRLTSKSFFKATRESKTTWTQR